VSVMPKPEFAPATKQDLKIKELDDSLPLTIISDGQYMEENLKMSDKNKAFFEKLIQDEKIKSIKKVLILTITKQGEIFLQEKDKPCKTLQV